MEQIQDSAAKQGTRDEIKVCIKDYLWDGNAGLPASFAIEEIEEKTEVVFAHVLMSARNGAQLQVV